MVAAELSSSLARPDADPDAALRWIDSRLATLDAGGTSDDCKTIGEFAAEAIADIDLPMLTRFHRKGIGGWDGMSRIDRIEELGNARYLVHAWSWGNGDDPVGSAYKFVVRVTGPSTYLEETYGETFTLCPNVPKAIRDAF